MRNAFVFITCLGILLVGSLLAGYQIANGAKQPGEPRKPSVGDVPFVTVDSGAFSGIARRQSAVVRDDSQWIDLWKKHTANQYPGPPLPSIDFNNEMVLGVFSGQQSSGGYAIRIERIHDAGDRLVASVREVAPGPGEITTMSLTQPFHIVKLGKTSQPVSFQGF